MVPPPRGTSSGLVSPEEEYEEEVEDMMRGRWSWGWGWGGSTQTATSGELQHAQVGSREALHSEPANAQTQNVTRVQDVQTLSTQ